jgi:glycosyltransferase involved in cell wall biosynthesis
MPKIVRITTIPLSLRKLLTGQMQYMQEHGFEVIMMSADGEGKTEVEKAEKVPHIVIPMTRQITPFQDLYSLFLLTYHFFKIKPDIVHSHTPKAGLLAMLAAKIAGVPIRIHTIAGLRFMTVTGFKRTVLVSMEKLTYWAANHVWANSFSILEYAKIHKLCPPTKLDIIGKGSSNGIDLNKFSKNSLVEKEIEETKKLINYSKDNIYLLSVGRMVKDKGIEELVIAFLAVQKVNTQLKLILLGPFEDELDPLSIETKTSIKNNKDIIHVHWSDKVENFMTIVNILIHPSHREGFPNVLLQAGAMECPIICSDIDGNIDIVRHQETGLLFKVKNIEDLVEKLKFALNNNDLLLRCKEMLFSEIKEKFDRKAVHQSILNQYLSLIKE